MTFGKSFSSEVSVMSEEQYKADMDAIRHELEAIWEEINILQGVDPAKVGEPNG